MPERPEWLTWLRSEAAAWVKDGLIDESQREKIVARYPDVPATPPPLRGQQPTRTAKSVLPAILVGLAVLLIGVGLVLFYAANWKSMAPPVKLAQVFLLILATYGGAFFFLFKKDAWTAAGRGLLMLAMLSFGAAIGLVAQTYHISAHPTNLVLLWAIVVMAMSGLMRERWGLYLAFVVVFIWDTWERTVFGNVNYAMLPVTIILYGLSVWIRSHVGRFAAVFLAIAWFYEVNFHYLIRGEDDSWLIFAFAQIPFGALLIAGALVLKDRIGNALTTTLRMLGWIVIYTPLIVLSWPIAPYVAFVWELKGAAPFLVEFAVLVVAAGALTFVVKRQGGIVWRFPAIALAVSVALIFVWFEIPGVLMTVMVLALLIFHGATLWAGSKLGLPGASIMAIILACATLAVRSIGHFFLAWDHDELIVAAGLSGFFFVAVIFLMNEAIRVRRQPGDAGGLLHSALAGISLAAAYLVLYTVSFFSVDQAGLADADTDWLVPAALISVIAIGLWIHLWFGRLSNRKVLVAAGITMVLALLIQVLPSELLPSTLRQIVLNAMLFLMAGSLIAYAVGKNSTALLNVGAAIVVMHIFTRYFDVFWSRLEGSIFFIVTGVVLFAVAGGMEWQRRRLVKQMRRKPGGAAEGGTPTS